MTEPKFATSIKEGALTFASVIGDDCVPRVQEYGEGGRRIGHQLENLEVTLTVGHYRPGSHTREQLGAAQEIVGEMLEAASAELGIPKPEKKLTGVQVGMFVCARNAHDKDDTICGILTHMDRDVTLLDEYADLPDLRITSHRLPSQHYRVSKLHPPFDGVDGVVAYGAMNRNVAAFFERWQKAIPRLSDPVLWHICTADSELRSFSDLRHDAFPAIKDQSAFIQWLLSGSEDHESEIALLRSRIAKLTDQPDFLCRLTLAALEKSHEGYALAVIHRVQPAMIRDLADNIRQKLSGYRKCTPSKEQFLRNVDKALAATK